MTYPGVQVFKRTIFENEVEEAGKINFASHRMNIGFATIRKIVTRTANDGFNPIPAEVLFAGTLKSFGAK